MGATVICMKCGQRYVTDYRVFHDPLKCEDCQPGPNDPDIDPELELFAEPVEFEYELGGEA